MEKKKQVKDDSQRTQDGYQPIKKNGYQPIKDVVKPTPPKGGSGESKNN